MVQFQENNLKFNSIRTNFTKGYKKHKFNWFCKDMNIYKENFICETFNIFTRKKKQKLMILYRRKTYLILYNI